MDMYAHLQLFQHLVAQIIDQNCFMQANNVQFISIREVLNDMQQWITKNPDAPVKLPRVLKGERRIAYATMDRCQQSMERDEKKTKRSLEICA
jgi:hypothetical protein